MRVFGLALASVATLALWGCSDKDPMSSAAEDNISTSAKLTVSGAVGASGSRRTASGLTGDTAGGSLTVSGARASGGNELGGVIAAPPVAPTVFTVTIENISPAFDFASSGAFNTPVGDDAPGALTPGNSYEFTFDAPPGSRLSFATMYVQSNDLFYAPGEAGIALWDDSGAQISGDITAQIDLWDAGTEVNQEPGVGADQAPRQAGPDTGADEGGVVQLVNDDFDYGTAADNIAVTITPTGATSFSVEIANLAASATPLAPGVWAVHTADGPLFTAGAADNGDGLEDLAEDGDPSSLAAALAAGTGVTGVLAPGVWAVHTTVAPLFTDGAADNGDGLEGLAEDGDPSSLDAALSDQSGVAGNGVFNTPVGADGPGAAAPGATYEFSISARPGDWLSFATMFVHSNDLFYAPDETGIALWDGNGDVIDGDITDLILLWDAGTEVNQAPGIGPDQAPRQAGANTGADENGVVQMVDDGFDYPATNSVIRVTISAQ